MLVLRKEIKIGIAAGMAILGIAGVYGLLASLSSNGDKGSAQVVSNNDDSIKSTINKGSFGLPPAEEPTQPVTPQQSVVVNDTPRDPKSDPFAESNRTDGNVKNDVWSSALSTGRINTVNGNALTSANDGPAIVKAPTTPKPDSRVTGNADASVHVDAPSGGNRAAAKATSSDTATASGNKYKIQSGDTFSTIAAKVYGNKKFYSVLVKANPDVNPSRMKVGQEITVPSKEQVASVGGAVETDPVKLAAPIDASRQYRVAPGDTLGRISQKLYGKSTQWQAIYEANKAAIGPDEAKLKVGTVLELPQKPVR